MVEKDFNNHIFNEEDLTLNLDIHTEICFSKKNLPKGEMVPVVVEGKEEYILIPLDTKDGSMIKISGRGKHDYKSGKTGDLYVLVHIKEQPIVRKKHFVIAVLLFAVLLAAFALSRKLRNPSELTVMSPQTESTAEHEEAITAIPMSTEPETIGEESVIEQGQEETENAEIPTQAPQASPNVMMSTYDILGAAEDYNTDRMHEFEEAMSRKPFWGQSEIRRSEIKKVVFLDSLENRDKDYWDVSATGDESVLAWVKDGVLYVAADGVITLSRSAVGMFSSFTNVTAIEFNNNIDTSQVTDMSDMFLGCWNLRSIDLTCFNTSKVTSMSSMFGSTSIEQLDVSIFDTANVISLAGMFANCEKLQYLDLSNFNTTKVESMSSVFANCYALVEVDLSGFNTGNVDNMNGLFYRCYSLKELDLSGFDTSKVKDMSWMFAACKMSQLDVSGFETDNLEDVTGMFRNSSITTLKCNSNEIQRAYNNR